MAERLLSVPFATQLGDSAVCLLAGGGGGALGEDKGCRGRGRSLVTTAVQHIVLVCECVVSVVSTVAAVVLSGIL